MTVREFIAMLSAASLDAEVRFMEVYGVPDPDAEGFPVTGMVYDDNTVVLTNEDKD